MSLFQTWFRGRSAAAAAPVAEAVRDPRSASEPPVPAGPQDDQAMAEDAALERARAALASSIPSAARVLLEPFAETTVRLDTLVILGKTRYAEGDLDAAWDILARAEKLFPMDRSVWKTMAEIFATRGQYVEELAYRRKLIYLVPKPRAEDYVAWARSFILAAKTQRPNSIQELSIAIQNLPTAAGSTPQLQMELSELLYAVKKLSPQALAAYRALSPPGEGERDIAARWVGLPEWCERVQAPLHRCSVPGCGPKEILLAELSNVIVAPAFQWVPILDDGSVALDGFIMHRMKPRRELATSPQLMHNGNGVELRLQRSMRVVEERALLLGGMPQYYHNTIDFLSALAVAEVFKIGHDVPLVVNDDLAPFQLEQLALAGYTPDRLIRVKADEQVLFRDLVVPVRLIRGGQWMHPLMPHWYRTRLTPPSPGPQAAANRRLYVSRRGASRRRVINDEEVAAALAPLGYEPVSPEALSVRDQAALFSQASHVVAPGGAALANQVFMPPGGQVLALTNRYVLEGLRDTYFDPLAQACGHRFAWLQGRAQEFHSERLIDADYEIDVGELLQALESLERG